MRKLANHAGIQTTFPTEKKQTVIPPCGGCASEPVSSHLWSEEEWNLRMRGTEIFIELKVVALEGCKIDAQFRHQRNHFNCCAFSV